MLSPDDFSPEEKLFKAAVLKLMQSKGWSYWKAVRKLAEQNDGAGKKAQQKLQENLQRFHEWMKTLPKTEMPNAQRSSSCRKKKAR
ncbi:MAG: hypothetical protein V1746_00145 [bacterium]